MPNGFAGSKDEWKKIEAPLLKIDKALKRFAQIKDLELSKNYHNWPERSLTRNEEGVERLIQIWLEDEKTMTFNFWICAWRDQGSQRYWKNMYLERNVDFCEIEGKLDDLLDQAMQILSSWKSEDLSLVH
jgi:uncharacterized protein YbaP (TraB family)